MPFHKILYPLGLSSQSDAALAAAVHMTRSFRAELVVAGSWTLPTVAYAADVAGLPADVVADYMNRDELGVARMVRRCRRAGAERVSARLLAGSPSSEVLGLLEDDHAIDLVVVGADGVSRRGGKLLLRAAKRVMKRAPCSVLVTSAHQDDPMHFNRILCPVDLADSSRAATSIACELAEEHGTITLLHASDESVLATGARLEERFEGLAEDLDRLDSIAHQMRAWTDADITTVSRLGPTTTEILDEVKGGHYDLVVLHADGHRMTSIGAKVVRHTPCPVLFVHPRE